MWFKDGVIFQNHNCVVCNMLTQEPSPGKEEQLALDEEHWGTWTQFFLLMLWGHQTSVLLLLSIYYVVQESSDIFEKHITKLQLCKAKAE